VANGPLIPGLREFDAPRRRPPGWLVGGIVAVVALALFVVLAGLFAGAGPLRSLGLVTTSLAPVSYRPTAADDAIQVSVAMPPSGLCRDDEVVVVAFERGNRIEVEASVTRPRRESCTSTAVGGDLHWVDVGLDAPLGERQVVRADDHTAVPRDSG
jgi:hypothetical protein